MITQVRCKFMHHQGLMAGDEGQTGRDIIRRFVGEFPIEVVERGLIAASSVEQEKRMMMELYFSFSPNYEVEMPMNDQGGCIVPAIAEGMLVAGDRIVEFCEDAGMGIFIEMDTIGTSPRVCVVAFAEKLGIAIKERLCTSLCLLTRYKEIRVNCPGWEDIRLRLVEAPRQRDSFIDPNRLVRFAGW